MKPNVPAAEMKPREQHVCGRFTQWSMNPRGPLVNEGGAGPTPGDRRPGLWGGVRNLHCKQVSGKGWCQPTLGDPGTWSRVVQWDFLRCYK